MTRLDENLCSKLTLAAMLLCLDFKSNEMTERISFPLSGRITSHYLFIFPCQVVLLPRSLELSKAAGFDQRG